MCHNCFPLLEVGLPPIIVTRLGRRALKEKRAQMRERRLEAEQADANVAENPDQQLNNRLVSKVKVYRKNWQPIIDANVETENAAEQQEGEIVYVEDLSDLTVEELLARDAPMEVERQTSHKTVWHRDIVAAKCILFKGIFD